MTTNDTDTDRRARGPIARIVSSPYFWLTVVAVIWGGNPVAGRAAAAEVPPFQLSFWRWVAAGAIWIPLGAANAWRMRRAVRGEWKLILMLGLVGIAGYSAFLFIAVSMTTALNALLLGAVVPAIMLILSRVLLNKSINAQQIIGIVVAFAGTIIIISHGDPAIFSELSFNIGDLVMLFGMFLWALYSVMVARIPKELSSAGFMALMSTIGIIALLPFFIFEVGYVRVMTVSYNSLAQILYVGMITSTVAYLVWNRAIVKIGPDKAGPYMYLPTLFGALLAVIFLGESLRLFHLVGALPIFAGVYLSTTGKRWLPGANRS